MTNKGIKRLLLVIILIQILIFLGSVARIAFYQNRPYVEGKETILVIPWPWNLEWQDGGFVMRLEVE